MLCMLANYSLSAFNISVAADPVDVATGTFTELVNSVGQQMKMKEKFL